MVKAVISGYYGFKNFGDETILSVLIKHLKNLNVDITVFSSDPNFTEKTYGINSIKSFDMIKVICTLRNTDVLISGGGSLLQDATSLKSLIYYLSVIALALFFNKKVIRNYFRYIIKEIIYKFIIISFYTKRRHIFLQIII